MNTQIQRKLDDYTHQLKVADNAWHAELEFTVEEANEEIIDSAIFYLHDLGYALIGSMYGGYSYGYQVQSYNEIDYGFNTKIKITFKFPKHQEQEWKVETYLRESIPDPRYEVSCANGH